MVSDEKDYTIEYVKAIESLTICYSGGMGLYIYDIKTSELHHLKVFENGVSGIETLIYEIMNLI